MMLIYLGHHGTAVEYRAFQLQFPALPKNRFFPVTGIVKNTQAEGSAADQLQNIVVLIVADIKEQDNGTYLLLEK